ncbi:MAG: AI-2E family transporter, partial [Patescibacteria group bacterium]|nr:AI-2E family transporter [Patescibacteria group bacterium]
RMSSYFFFIVLLGAFLAAIFIFLPFLSPVLLALAAAVIVYPVYRDLRRFWGQGKLRDTLAALATVILVLAVILIPIFFLVGTIYGEVQTLYSLLIDEANRSAVINALNAGWTDLSNLAFGVLPPHSFDSFNVTESLKSGLEWVFANLDTVFTSLAKVAGYALIFLMALFYFLRDGVELKRMVFSWSPQLAQNEGYMTGTFKGAIRSVFAGTLVVSILEGLSIGLAFTVFGIPAPALWGTVAAVAALVPAFGVTLIVLPGAAYLALSGNFAFAAGLLLWGYAGIVLIDHIIGPNITNRGIKVHPFLVLLSVLGGLLMFGLIGFVLGPLILVILFTLLEIYKNAQGNI